MPSGREAGEEVIHTTAAVSYRLAICSIWVSGLCLSFTLFNIAGVFPHTICKSSRGSASNRTKVFLSPFQTCFDDFEARVPIWDVFLVLL
jgi:hypothetical protein